MTEEWNEVSQGKILKLDEDNPEVEGIFVGTRSGQFGPLYDIQQVDGTVVTLPSDTVLVTKLTDNLKGKMVKIVFKGMVESTKRRGKEYKDYNVFVKGAK